MGITRMALLMLFASDEKAGLRLVLCCGYLKPEQQAKQKLSAEQLIVTY